MAFKITNMCQCQIFEKAIIPSAGVYSGKQTFSYMLMEVKITVIFKGNSLLAYVKI